MARGIPIACRKSAAEWVAGAEQLFCEHDLSSGAGQPESLYRAILLFHSERLRRGGLGKTESEANADTIAGAAARRASLGDHLPVFRRFGTKLSISPCARPVGPLLAGAKRAESRPAIA